MYAYWPSLEKISEIAGIDENQMQVEASRCELTAIWHVQVPTVLGEFVLGASAFGASTLFFPDTDDFNIIDRSDYYNLAAAGWGRKMAIEAGIELMGYTLGEIQKFSVPVDLSYLTKFQQDVLLAIRKIPFGDIVTVSELAALAGHPRKFAAVANVVKHNPLPVLVPCHRVVPTKGGIGNWSGPSGWKKALLEHEGIAIEDPRA